MRFNISNFLFFSLFLVFFSCGHDPLENNIENNSNPNKKKNKQQNFIVVLDLSDRLIKQDIQIQNDTSIINHLYDKFLFSVKSNAYIKSNDRFVVIPIQEGNHFNRSSFINQMSVDMKTIIPLKDRTQKEVERTNRIKNTVNKLYSKSGAVYSKKCDDYGGADIWKFIKDDLKDYLVKDTNFNNNLIILTDGYLFVDGKQKEINEVIESVGQNYSDYNINAVVAEITPKDNRDDEWQALQNQWVEWMNDMQVKKIKILKSNAINIVKTKIDEFLKSPFENSTKTTTVNKRTGKQLKCQLKSTEVQTNKQKVQDKQIIKPKVVSNSNAIKLENFIKYLENEQSQEKRFDYFINNIYPIRNDIKVSMEYKEILSNIKSDLSYLKISSPTKQINGKTYSDYYDQL